MSFLSRSRHLLTFKTPPLPSSESISLTCRDKPISREELFQYTNGRFLTRDKQQRDGRYVKFDLEALCAIAASTGPSVSPVREVEKLEGGFSKALRIRRENGTELIAKVPCPNAGLAKYTTASEVAILEYESIRTSQYHTSILGVFPVGAEYIIMEKAAGVQLLKVWDQIDEPCKLAIIKQLAKWESQLMSIKFPAYGCVYSRRSFPEGERSVNLPADIDRSESYCVGRSCDPTWSTVPENLILGPWPSLAEFGTALAKREIYRISQESKSVHVVGHRGTAAEQISLLETTIELMKILGSHSDLLRHAQPTACHTDLHMGNIFVSENDPSKISTIIDWQFTQVAPMFLQARWPVLLTLPKGYPAGIVTPKLPDDYKDLDEKEKKLAEYNFNLATAAKAYEIRCLLDNKDAYDAMNLPRVYRELFIRCGATWEEGPAPLRECLIEIFNSWHDLDLPGECPYIFREEEI
ncbi:hypothetical protein Z517_00627 [Fonsecaea pedrosoi CBS 271.37]|uniref:Altered inheritance of mitochondria protein 9, mitochondrial n=1 Tax=Fonsecaea pedrosoi CBS 271.37 TaxID=1442368 RepID=A0A0D2FF16_9EURO|nr:uncharacterized protein Z517_00627 [Fonsecaea pedrosoi CBS 271.37]KIW85237.1 hypothetical protein Z517_00627 [Fonsecaea pedrosoi CBS 271.37]